MAAEDAEMRAELDRLRAENEALKSRDPKALRLQVSKKGCVSIYGIRRFPLSYYADEWDLILGMADEIREFIQQNEGSLKRK